MLKVLKYARNNCLKVFDNILTRANFYINGIKYGSINTRGIPKISVDKGATCVIGAKFKMNSREMANPIGRFQRCCIIVRENGKLNIGNNVGISSTTIVCHRQIEIGNFVNLGGNVVIYDTDFHSLNFKFRQQKNIDRSETKTEPVKIENHVFIGAHSTILKGVTIGENSIIGACSVVTKNIPENEIWGGNPAKFIRKINEL